MSSLALVEPAMHPASPRLRRAASAAVLAAAAAACASSPPPPPPVPAPAAASAAPPPPLQVAAGPAEPPAPAREIVVDARSPRTPLGRFPAGARVRIKVIEALWKHDPGAPFVGTEGAGAPCRSASPDACIGGDAAAPLMGLILLRVAPGAEPAPAEPVCQIRHRLPIPSGVEFAVPEEADLDLAPNDHEDALLDNTGSIQVTVETSAGPRAPASSRRDLRVEANQPRTPAGHFLPGQYVRISVLGGRWTHDPAAPLVGAAGSPRERCSSGGGAHRCLGGDGAAPRMGLFLLMRTCAPAPPALAAPAERRFIPRGVDLVVPEESDLFLAPNDREDSLSNNAGTARVAVEVEGP